MSKRNRFSFMARIGGCLLLAWSLPFLGCEPKEEKKEKAAVRLGKGPQVGQVVDILGQDLDGKEFKLSDYRGKVVMLDFWATWCGPCRALFANNRSLVHRYQDKPFVLLGVNSDARAETPKKLVAAGEVTWRSFWDGPSSAGPILSRWEVFGLPTISLIDADGKLRYHMFSPFEVEDRVEELVKEAEQKS